MGNFGKTRGRMPVNLFFTELIISLLFFSISGAVILRAFAVADNKARKSAELQSAVLCAQSIAEAYSVSGSIPQAFSEVFSENCADGGSVALDKNCTLSGDGSIVLAYSEERTDTAAGTLAELTLVFSEGSEEIYSLKCSAYIPKGGAPDE